MLIKVEDLQVGDEILTAYNAHFRYLRVMRLPRSLYIKDPVTGMKIPKMCRWSTPVQLYGTTIYSAKMNQVEYSRVWGGITHNYTREEWFCTPEDHNIVKYMQLSGRDIWLVKRD